MADSHSRAPDARSKTAQTGAPDQPEPVAHSGQVDTPVTGGAADDSRVDGLDAGARALFASLAALPDALFTLQAAMAVSGIREEAPAMLSGLGEAVVGPGDNAPVPSQAALRRLEASLSALVEAGLISAHGAHYHFAPGAYALAGRTPGGEAAPLRLLESYVEWVEKHQRDAAAMQAERAGWGRAIDTALALGKPDSFLYLAAWTSAPGGYFHRQRDLDSRMALLRRAARMVAERVDPLAAWILFNYAAVLREVGEIDEAIQQLTRSAYVAEATGGEEEAGMARGELAALLMLRGDLAGAADLYHQKLKAMQNNQNPGEFARTCGDLAEVLVAQGNHEDALSLLEQQLGLFQAMGNERGAAMVRATLGDLLAETGDFAGAVNLYQRALPILEQLDVRNAAVARANLGVYQQKAGDAAGAAESFRRALAIFEQYQMAGQVADVLECLRELEVES